MSALRRFREITPGILVSRSELYLTNTTVVVADDGTCLVIDPAVTVADIAEQAADLVAAGLRPVAGYATHPHWDHVLWARALGDVPRYAVPRAVTTAGLHHDEMLDQVESSAPGHDRDLFAVLTPLPDRGAGDAELAIPWSGPPARVIVHDGHARGHGALFFPDAGVLIAGDMLSDVEIPLLDLDEADPIGDYRTGLERLGAVAGVGQLVPGHGHVTGADGLAARLDADTRYVGRLGHGEQFDDPRADAAAWMRDHHARQLRL
jgi:glyoxylase-like metal-dependent hydrolase (beta-lactamase superfamily II)